MTRIRLTAIPFVMAAAIAVSTASACGEAAKPEAARPNANKAEAVKAEAVKPSAGDAQLAQQLSTIASSAGGTIGVAAIHVETGRTVEVQGGRPLPLYSVFKLPVAVVILKDIDEGRLKLDQKVHFTKAEVVPGSAETMALWPGPVDRSIRELLDLSIAKSDNTSADKLLEMAGGPGSATRKLAAMEVGGITIHRSVREFLSARKAPHPNTASAVDLARLLARLQKGEILRPDSRAVLFEVMANATTGLKRIRGGVPPGTLVGDKTGSGPGGSSTNDIGIITLPGGKGHVAIAVLVSGSKRPVEAQEKAIADIARAVYDAHVSAH